MIDEYITSGRTKWQQDSGVVLLLPHGYEGQGPDHSSARIERFLQMAADDAIQIAQPSSPASHFHLLRTHAHSEDHRPLIIFTPKSMLRRKEAASQPEDFTSGTFRPVIGDDMADKSQVETLLMVSGRLTWDIVVDRAKRGLEEKVAIARTEQLYPWPIEELKAEIAPTPTSSGSSGSRTSLQPGSVADIRTERRARARRTGRGRLALGLDHHRRRHLEASSRRAAGAARPGVRRLSRRRRGDVLHRSRHRGAHHQAG